MSAGVKPHPSYVTIWVWLVVLVGVAVASVAVPLSRVVLVTLLFAIAAVKAALVVRHYMHLRAQPLLLYAIAGVPVLLAIGLLLALVPDIALRP